MNVSTSLRFRQDRKLAKKLLGGDEKAFKQFVDEYFPRLYRYASHRLNNDSDVEEVVQTVLTIAAHKLHTYRGEATLLTWLVQICRHEISRQLKKTGREENLMRTFLNDDFLKAIVESVESEPQNNPDAECNRKEVITLIQVVMDQLPHHYAEVLEMKYIQGCSSQEIAAHMQQTDSSIQSLLARARNSFKGLCGEVLHTMYGQGGSHG